MVVNYHENWLSRKQLTRTGSLKIEDAIQEIVTVFDKS